MDVVLDLRGMEDGLPLLPLTTHSEGALKRGAFEVRNGPIDLPFRF